MNYIFFYAIIFFAIFGAFKLLGLLYRCAVGKIADKINKKDKSSEYGIIDTRRDG